MPTTHEAKPTSPSPRFREAVRCRESQVMEYLLGSSFRGWFTNTDLQKGVYAYLERPSKRLRPVVLMLACGAAGEDESLAIPAAAGVELFHTWTLVHDDLIDHDDLRRGAPTVHHMFAEGPPTSGPADVRWRAEYGRDMAVLVGDSQQAWSVWMILETGVREPRLAPVAIQIAQHLESIVINRLIDGEIQDVQFTRERVDSISRERILEMLYLKTGALYEFSAAAGAAIGLGKFDWGHPWIRAGGTFGRLCGTAFQLQDDILGIIGDPALLGKPVGSDIREGKRTTVTFYAYENAGPTQRKRLIELLGKRDASPSEIDEARDLLIDLGGIRETAALAREMTEQALPALDALPDSESKDLLRCWAEFLIDREF